MFIFDVTIWLKVVTFNYQQGEEESASKNIIKIGLDNELNFSKEFSLCFRIIFKVIFLLLKFSRMAELEMVMKIERN